MRTAACIAFAAFTRFASAQTADAQLTFEVASVRVSAPVSGTRASPRPVTKGGPGTDDPEQIVYERVGILNILLRAFGVLPDQIVGPAWVSDVNFATSQKFDIQAKVPPGTSKEQANVMMQNLLKERLGLRFHRETKEFTVYELTSAKGGPKLKEAEQSDGNPAPLRLEADGRPARDKDGFVELPPGRPNSGGYVERGVDRMSARMQSSQNIANALGGVLGTRHVIDKTGLTGKYDFNLEFSKVGLPSPAALLGLPPPTLGCGAGPDDVPCDPAPDIFTAVEKQLGLKLTKANAPLEVIVIDRIQKVPTEN
jgi:uncharacterized protein (TIGR03435 family)